MRNLVLCALSFLLISCNERNQVVESPQSEITLSVQNLRPLDGGHYQLWATFLQFNKSDGTNSPLHDDDFVSLGEFMIASDGSIRNLEGEEPHFALPAGSNAQLLQDIVIAIQPEHEEGSLSKTHHEEPGSILAGGKFYGDAQQATADLTLSYADAFATDFSSVTGRCTITAATSISDSNSGVWFVETSSSITQGIRNAPPLPAEWRYEGWVRYRDSDTVSYRSTGKFMRADSADYDGAGPYSDTTRAGYNFPGQDFVRGAGAISNLLENGYTFMITVEPFPDNSAGPFFLSLLETNEYSVPPTSNLLMLNVITSVAPSAHVVIKR